ncbi:MAG TPA: hypothetical protein PLL10_07660 [Elusimicrobiales bacterium]|nr:hypothetical protein [Elusimicrobiales bacterium]
MANIDIKKLLEDTFSEIAMVLGGIFVIHDVADEAVRKIMKHLDITHENALSKLDGINLKTGEPNRVRHSYEHHPAVAAFLLKIRKHGQLPGREA